MTEDSARKRKALQLEEQQYAKIKDTLESLDEAPVVPMVPARGNDGIGGRDRSKVRACGT